MSIFDPGVFSSEFNTQLGMRLWDFFNEPENIIRMETATKLQRPAIEGLEEELLQRFGEDILVDRVKQMMGRMAKQVMEHKGYVIDQQNVKITSGAPFSRATRYKQENEMTFYVFKNNSEPRRFALTGDKAGASLRDNSSRWTYWKSFKGGLRGRIAFGLEDENAAREDIRRQGYHIYSMSRLLKSSN